MSYNRPLPFYFNDVYWGLAKIDGILSIDGEQLLIEFQQKDSFAAVLKSRIQKIEVSLKELASAEFDKKMIGSRLILHAKSSEVFKDIPGEELTKRVFKIKKEYRPLAEQLKTLINIKLSEYKLDDLYE